MGRILPRCWQAVASAPGTGAIALGAALAGYQTLAAAGAVNGDTISYWVVDGNAWECGQGAYSTTGPTLTRTTLEASSTGAALNLSAAATIYCAPTPRDLAPKFAIDKPLDDQILNASGTWTKPAVAGSWAIVELWGGGMGGGKGATTSLRYGGSGGCYQQFVVPFADLPTTASATIGAGGAGATANAAKGTAGGTTSFLGISCLGGTEDIYGDASNYPSGRTTPSPVYKSPVALYMPSTSGPFTGTSAAILALSPVADVQEQGGRGPVSSAVGASLFSGGRGAGATAANVKLAASASTNGGSGADSATTTNNTAGVAGSAPGGGGSAGTGTGSGGAGAAGRVRVRIY